MARTTRKSKAKATNNKQDPAQFAGLRAAGLAPRALLFAQSAAKNSCRSHQWSAGSWSWCASDRCPRPRDRVRTRAVRDCRNIRCRGIVLREERQHPVVQQVGRGERCLAVIELGEGDLGIGVDEGLLVDAT